MGIEIIDGPLLLNLCGFSARAVDKDYVGTAFRLMDEMWKTVKLENLKTKGRNVWVYEPNEMVFAGVEIESFSGDKSALEKKDISLTKYAYYKHVGPYSLIKHAGAAMREELSRRGFWIVSPYVEIYGHWTNDETKLETELVMAVEIK